MSATRLSGFLGRTSERQVLDGLLAIVRGGMSDVPGIRGEAGIDKTALLRYAVRQASGFQVAQVTGVEAEMELPFAGIHQLCARILDKRKALPQPQQDAIVVAIREPAASRDFDGLPSCRWRAADPLGDATLVRRAERRLDIDASALAHAEQAELLQIGARVQFRHPLVRSAVYRSASLGNRQRVHEVLAEVSDPETDADRRAWHRALAVAGPDEDAAAELERSAGRAQPRGGAAAAAAFRWCRRALPA
jgi:hypothetical protein